MSGNVVFEEARDFDSIPVPKQQIPTMGDVFLKARIVGSPGDAAILLSIIVVILIGVSFYLLISAVQPPPTLGSDVLRPGEVPASPAQ